MSRWGQKWGQKRLEGRMQGLAFSEKSKGEELSGADKQPSRHPREGGSCSETKGGCQQPYCLPWTQTGGNS